MRNMLFIGTAMLASTPAFAADQVGQTYLTPNAGAIFTDSDRRIDNDEIVYGVGLGRHFSKAWSGEINFLDSDNLDFDTGSGQVSFRSFSADALRVFNRGSRVAPYLTIGAGNLRNRYSTGAHTDDFMVQAGAGLLWKLSESDTGSFSLRPEVKARLDEAGADGHLIDYIATLGLQLSFGGKPAPVVAAAPPPPPPPVVQAPPPPPPPPADEDNDGVIDARDQCLGTPAGTLVDNVGCPLRGAITLQGVNFEHDSAELTADSRPILAGIASDLKKFPRLRVEMQGHTDSSGSDQYNLALSQRRADSVRSFLVGEGVVSQQITARGYGETQPIADNKTAPGRADNRRVVMAVLDNPGNVKVEGESR
jgi:OmpA-OmpF porin, OOP family